MNSLHQIRSYIVYLPATHSTSTSSPAPATRSPIRGCLSPARRRNTFSGGTEQTHYINFSCGTPARFNNNTAKFKFVKNSNNLTIHKDVLNKSYKAKITNLAL